MCIKHSTYCQNSSAEVIVISVIFEYPDIEAFFKSLRKFVDKFDDADVIYNVKEMLDCSVSDWFAMTLLASSIVSLQNCVFQLFVQSVQGSGSWKAFTRKSIIQHLRTVVPIIHKEYAATIVTPIPI